MLHHWLQRDNKWAAILGLFEAYLWILRQIFPFRVCFFERQRTWGDGRSGARAGDVREAESWRFGGVCRPKRAAALSMAGVYSCSCAQVGICTPFPHLAPPGEGWTPNSSWENTSGLCFFDSRGVWGGFPHPAAAGMGLLAKQEWPSHKSQVSGMFGVGVSCCCQICLGENQAKLSIKQKTI